MQLSSDTSLRSTIAALTASLLGASASNAAEPIRTEASILLYSESSRVTTGEAAISLHRQLNEFWSYGLHLTYDGLTGASPNGATPSRKVQTFTGPSAQSRTIVQPGQTPLDKNFKDNRVSGSATISRLLDRMTTVDLGAHLSFESDYTSLGLSSGLTRDLFQKNTTLGLSGSISHDIVFAKGGIPVPFASIPPPKEGGERGGDDEGEGGGGTGPGKGKNIADVVAGITQVINRSTMLRMNYSLDRATGYQNDPYKIVSVVLPESSPDAGEPVDYVYENRPDTRLKRAVYGELLKSLGPHTLDLSYRYFWDSWGITSRTAEMSLQMQLSPGKSLEPHLRWYRQSEADFYRPFLIQGESVPNYASADTRLAKFDAMTFGLKYSFPILASSRASISGEYYYQHGDKSPPEAFGSMRDLNLFPNLNAFMIRLGFANGL